MNPEPFFSPLQASERSWPFSQKFPPSGFGYPLGVFSFPVPRKPLSAPNAPGFLPSELLSTSESKKRFPFSSFIPALSFKTFPALNRRSDDFLLRNSHSPSLLPEGLAQVGGVGSRGLFSPFRLSLPLHRRRKHLPFFFSPLNLSPSLLSQEGLPWLSGSFRSRRPGFFLFRTPACPVFSTILSRHLFKTRIV